MGKDENSVKKKSAKKKVTTGPMVSIVMPVYNEAKTIDDTIHSVLGQTYENWELIIVDDHSSDNTLEVISQFGSDKIMIIARKRNSGAGTARNRGILEAKGKIICFLNAGDVWQPSKLAEQLEFLKETGAEFIAASYVKADKKGRPKGKVVRAPAEIRKVQAKYGRAVLLSSTMFDMRKLSKMDLKDIAKWDGLFRKIEKGRGMHEVMVIRGQKKRGIFGRGR